MITLAQRIEALRTERGLSRPALSQALGFPKNAAEKFETGRQTPTREQQEKMAAFFGVSLFYLRGRATTAPVRRPGWTAASRMRRSPLPRPATPPGPSPRAAPAGQDQGTVFDAFLHSKAFQDMIRAAVQEALRSPEGQDILTQAVRKELARQR